MDGCVDGQHDPACSTFINTCALYCLWQPHADKVLDCAQFQVNHKRFPSTALQPPTVK